jgi:hypothetical protein
VADIPVNFSGTVRGVNLTTAPGDYSLEDLWSNWNWSGWIRPQIDKALALGAKAIRLIGSVQVVNLGTISQATYNARMAQFCAYCVANGLAIYPTGCATYGTGGTPNGVASLSNAAIAGVINSMLDWIFGVTGPTNYAASCIGADVVQEANGNVTASQVNAIYALVKPHVPSPVGVTFSSTQGIPSDSGWLASVIGSLDYLDLHVYPQTYGIGAQPTPSQVTSGPHAAYPTKDILFGEGGCNASSSANGGPGYSDAQISAWIAGLGALWNMGTPSRGGLVWGAEDQDLSEQYGGFNAGVPRSSIVLPHISNLASTTGPNAPTNLRPLNGVLTWDPTGCTTQWDSSKIYRNGAQIANPLACRYDDSAAMALAKQYRYTATALTASAESAPTAMIWPGRLARRQLRRRVQATFR